MHRHRTARRIRAVVAAVLVGSVICCTVLGAALAPYAPNDMNPIVSLSPPSGAHPFGADLLGRDVLSRVLVGTRLSVGAALLAVCAGAVPGTVIGIVGGMVGSRRSSALSSIMDAWMAVPGVLVAVVMGAGFGRSATVLAFALGFAGIPSYYRQARVETLKHRSSEYVDAARASGAAATRIWFRHVLPNIMPTLAVFVTLRIGGMLLAISALSFLGLGTQPPAPEWGTMLSDGRDFMDQAWWLMVFPGLAIAWTVFGLNLLGDLLRDRLDRRS